MSSFNARQHLALPMTFLGRPCDRLFYTMAGKLGVDKHYLRTSLLLLWQEYASGGTNKHALDHGVDDDAWPTNPAVCLIEDYVEWQGERGEWTKAAIAAGILKIEEDTDGKKQLQLVDFFPYNKHLSAGYVHNQALGGIGKKVKQIERRSSKMAAQQLKLLTQGNTFVAEVAGTPAEKEAAVALVQNIYGLLDVAIPTPFAPVMEACMQPVLEILRSREDADIALAKRYIYMHKDSPEIPKDPIKVVERFTTLIEKAKDQ